MNKIKKVKCLEILKTNGCCGNVKLCSFIKPSCTLQTFIYNKNENHSHKLKDRKIIKYTNIGLFGNIKQQKTFLYKDENTLSKIEFTQMIKKYINTREPENFFNDEGYQWNQSKNSVYWLEYLIEVENCLLMKNSFYLWGLTYPERLILREKDLSTVQTIKRLWINEYIDKLTINTQST